MWDLVLEIPLGDGKDTKIETQPGKSQEKRGLVAKDQKTLTFKGFF